MSNINIKRTIENIRSGTNVYTPIIELIVNAIQATRTVKPKGGEIKVTVLRSAQKELGEQLSAVDGFIVEDNGVGFDKRNRDSFDTLFTDLKVRDGGKGFGRFTCLKYFHNFVVDSVFYENTQQYSRQFKMGTDDEIIVDEKVNKVSSSTTGSTVTISGIKSVKYPDKGLDIIARVLVEHLLPYFIDSDYECPRIIIRDSADKRERILNDYLSSDDREIIELPIENPSINLTAIDSEEKFDVRVFKLYAPKTMKSKVSLVAHHRVVTETPLHKYIPEFADEFYERGQSEEQDRDRNFIIKAYVLGRYLDSNVSLERGTFKFKKDDDLIYGLSQSQIEETAAQLAQQVVSDEIKERKERKEAHIRKYVETSAPWHRSILTEVDFSSLPMKPSNDVIESHLQVSKFKIEQSARAAVSDVLKSDKPDELDNKAAQIVELISQTNKNDLIHYVSMRKCVLELFEKALEKDEDGKYKSEGAVHDIIVARRTDIDELDYDNHNLWILDERLNFAAYASSEKPVREERGADRSDLSIFNRPVVFRGDNEPSNPVTIFEFKRPQRDDFTNLSAKEDPVEQIRRYVTTIQDGKCTLPNGRTIKVTNNTPFYGYLICDLTPKVNNWLHRVKDFTEMPDGLGWFHWYSNIRLYIEVLSFDKILMDASMRNKIFFKKLGIE